MGFEDGSMKTVLGENINMETTELQTSILKAEPPIAFQEEKPRKYNGKQKVILEAANHVISKKGIKAATITEIAQKAGVADSIIYHYFKNKQDLVFSLLDMHLLITLEELKFYFTGIMGPVSKLGKMIWHHLYQNEHGNTQVRKNLLLQCRAHPDFRKQECYRTLSTYLGIMDDLLQSGIDEGYFCPGIKIPVVRSVILGLLDEEALRSRAPGGPSSTMENFDSIMSLVLGMIERRPPSNASSDKPDKHENILKAAKYLFAQKGFHNATMAEVARRAGVAEGTIYEYFKNKHDLLMSITKAYFGQFKHKLDNTFFINDPIEKLRRVMWHHFFNFAADSDLVTVFLKDTKLNKDFYGGEAHDLFVSYHDKFCEVVDEGKAAGAFRAEIDTNVFRSLIMGSLANLYLRWYFRDPIHALDYMEEMHHYVELVCRAVAVPAQCDE